MNTVALFFWHNVLATLLLGGTFASRKDSVLRNFGIALLLDAVAFGVWALAVTNKPVNLEYYVSIGVIFFVISLLFYLRAGISDMSSKAKLVLTAVGVVVVVATLYARTAVYTSAPGFSPEGFFFFNPHAVVQMLYIFGLALTTVPAINAVASKFSNSYYRAVVRYGFTAQVAGGIVLLTSNINNPDTTALLITGWIIGLVYLFLWISLVVSKKAW